MPAAPTRWGILGSGSIAKDFVRALYVGDPAHERHVVASVAARSVDSAKQFVQGMQLPESTKTSTYEQLYNDDTIDVIYIANINRLHKDVVLNAISAGRNVLCEKPMGVNAAEVREMNEAAKKRNVFLMEGYWSAFFPAQQEVKRLVDTQLGTLRCVQISFCFPIPGNKLADALGGGGMLYACGYYIVSLCVHLLGAGAKLSSVRAVCTRDPANTDATMQFSFKLNDTLVQGFTSTETGSGNEALIVGDKGSLRIPSWFHTPTQIETFKPNVKREFTFDGLDDKKFIFPNSSGFIFEGDHVRDCLLKGLKESTEWTAAHALLVGEILEAVRKAAGVVYPQDK